MCWNDSQKKAGKPRLYLDTGRTAVRPCKNHLKFKINLMNLTNLTSLVPEFLY
jgi:hypothetical protein